MRNNLICSFSVNPGKVSKPRPVKSGKTWFEFKAHLTKHVQTVCAVSAAACDNWLKLEYSVAKVTEKEEQRLTPEKEDFFQEYGIYRNLEDDEEAMAHLNLTNFTYTNVSDGLAHSFPSLSHFFHPFFYRILLELLHEYKLLSICTLPSSTPFMKNVPKSQC